MAKTIEKVYSEKPYKRLLIIKEVKIGLRGVVKKYNKETSKYETISSANFEGKEASTYRVKEYFKFNSNY